MATTFSFEVAGIGSFTMRRRTIRDQYWMEAEQSRILGGPTRDEFLSSSALKFATLLRLMTESPDGFDLEAIDPLDQEDVQKIHDIYGRLREEEARFRTKS